MCTVITQSRYRNVSDLTATARNKGGDPHEGEKHMNRKAGVSKHLRFKDSFMDRAFMYTLALQSHKGSEYGECYYAASKIRDGDPESWMKAWTEVAKRVEDIARKADAKGHRVSAREAYLRAFTYYRRAFAAMRPTDPRFRETCDTFRACFRRFAALHDTPIEIVEVLFESKSLPGYFMRANVGDGKRPTVVIGDNFAEELYFWVGPAGVSRGYNVLLVDLPGIGTMPFEGVYFRVDTEAPVRAVVDYLLSRNDVDTSRIAIYGGGEGGGYIVTRAVAYEKRIGACIANPLVYDMGSVLKSVIPQLLQRAPWFISDTLFKLVEKKNTLGSIALEQGFWQLGETEPSRAFEVYESMKVDANRITCPVLCLAGTSDSAEVLRQAQEAYQLLSNPQKAIHVFTEEEGADAFRQVNNFSLQHQVAFDWLDEVFDRNAKQAAPVV